MKIVFLTTARNDLKEIHAYLSNFGETPLKKFRESLEKFCGQVSEMPYMFNQYEYNSAYRKAIVAYDYLIFYQLDESGRRVKIYRVLHGKRDVARLIAEDE